MKDFHCPCGRRVFFDSTRCLGCGRDLGFDPGSREVVPLGDGLQLCRNGVEHAICNWLVPTGPPRYCAACELNEVIPSLDVADNLTLWARLEAAKRRLLYNLFMLELPVGGSATQAGLRFRFLEDRRRNPAVFEDFVTTGHRAGTITINLAEADDVERTSAREAMQERYRTLLGHFRHECGHYYYSLLIADHAEASVGFAAAFGDPGQDYAASMQRYYAFGAPPDWPARFVSPYAAAHPWEDWAETFAHYLHIRDALETAHAAGLASAAADGGSPGWIVEWVRLAVTLNELNRSLGIEDPYPFVLTEPVIAKLEFIDRQVRRLP